jgi:hypothetical protein
MNDFVMVMYMPLVKQFFASLMMIKIIAVEIKTLVRNISLPVIDVIVIIIILNLSQYPRDIHLYLLYILYTRHDITEILLKVAREYE